MSKPETILWINAAQSDPKVHRLLTSLSGYSLENISDIPYALRRMRAAPVNAVFANFPALDWLPAALLEEAQRIDARIPVFLRDTGATLADAVRLTKLGAHQFF